MFYDAATLDAPLGTYKHDGPFQLTDYMFQRFNEKFGDVDVLLAPGDMTGHGTSSKVRPSTEAMYQTLKDNLQISAELLAKWFPNTIVIPTQGNNDGRYHDSGPNTDEKADYFGFLWKQWFENMPGNAELVKNPTIKENFLYGGFCRIDIAEGYSVLQLNTQYFDIQNASEFQIGEAEAQMSWLQYQLQAGNGRKFIITNHVYPGTRYQSTDMWNHTYNKQYMKILRDNADKVIIEVSGHDHYADLRYHSSDNVYDLPDTATKFDFHNLFVAPGITPNKGQNPGVTIFDVNNGIPSNMHMEFLNLEKTLGGTTTPAYSNLEWFSLDLASKFGLNALDATSLAAFRKHLEADKSFALDYIVAKLGFNPADATQAQRGLDLMAKKDLITSSKHKTGEFICQMHKSISVDEYDTCTATANNLLNLDYFLQ